MSENLRIALLGGGAMGEALISGLIAKGLAKGPSIIVAEPRPERRAELEARHGVRTTDSNAAAADGAALVLLAVKPQVLEIALADMKGRIGKDAILLSIVAGATSARIKDLSGHDRIVRCMPNTPAQIGMGISGWYAACGLGAEGEALVKSVLSALGDEVRLGDEAALDKVTAVSGSGPAYVFLFAEAMVDAAVRIGLARDVATRLVQATLSGSAEYWKSSGLHAAVLRNQVTSPAGTTAAALHEFEEGAFRATVEKAVNAAFERSKELGKG